MHRPRDGNSYNHRAGLGVLQSTMRATSDVDGDLIPVAGTWDERVQLNPLFWMAEHARDRDSLLASGVRDFATIVAGLDSSWLRTANALEVGCGIGRLLRAAMDSVRTITGTDSSIQALAYAKSIFKGRDTPRLVPCSGMDLCQVKGEFDFIFSFATLGHLTPHTFVRYVQDIRARICAGGIARLQVYLGSEVLFAQDDTFSIRSYEETRFRELCKTIGFSVVAIEGVPLPFDGVDYAHDRCPMIADLRPLSLQQISPADGVAILCTGCEPLQMEVGSHNEYGVVITRANELIRHGELEEARRFIRFALTHYKAADVETKRALDMLNSTLD